MRQSAALLFCLSLVLGLATSVAHSSAPGAIVQSPAPSPSDPPFWARPRPAQPRNAPECDCAADTTLKPQGRGALSPLSIGLAIGGLAFLLLLWRWTRPKPIASSTARFTPAVTPTGTLKAAAARIPLSPAPMTHSLAVAEGPSGTDGDIELAESEEEPTTEESLKFYSDVANSLSEAIEKHPDRQDLWRKLFEVYSTSKMASEFVNLAYAFLERHGGRSNQHWYEIGSMGRILLPEHELFRDFGDKPAARRTLQFRRYYDRKLDQGAMFRAQEKLEAGFNAVRNQEDFKSLLRRALADGAQRPSPVAPAPLLDLGEQGARIFMKREDRRRASDENLINSIGQVLLAQHLGHRRVLTATRDGTHAIATATVAARLGMECVVYISESDLHRQYARVLSLRRLGALVRPVRIDDESRFGDPRQYALTDWLENPGESQYICGLSGGPQPFPMIVGEFQASVGHEAAVQMQNLAGRPPEAVVAHAADGYFGLGLLRGFLEHETVKLYYVDAPDPDHSEVDGASSMYLREHRWLRDSGRVLYVDGQDSDAMRVVEQFHGAGTSLNAATGRSLAYARQVALQSDPGQTVLVAYSGQADAGFRTGGSDY